MKVNCRWKLAGELIIVKKILILTAKIGSGHITPALAVKMAIEKFHPGEYKVDVVDFAYESGAILTDKFLKSSWNGALTFPFLTKLVFNILNFMYPAVSSKSLSCSIFRSWLFKGTKYIKGYKPDIIFSTHFLCSSIACSARLKEKMEYDVICFVTDPFGGHKLWADKRIDKFLISTKKAKEYLINIGVKAEITEIIPYPLKQEFFAKEVESKLVWLNAKENKLTVLVSYGGQGIGKSYKIIRDICKKNLKINIIAVAGNNKKLQNKLENLRNRTGENTNLTIEGYVDNMHSLMQKADMLISKAGPASVFESIATDCPIVITHWVGLNEKYTMEFVVENRTGWFIPGRNNLGKFLEKLTQNEILSDYKQNILRLKKFGEIQRPIENGAECTAKIITDRFHS